MYDWLQIWLCSCKHLETVKKKKIKWFNPSLNNLTMKHDENSSDSSFKVAPNILCLSWSFKANLLVHKLKIKMILCCYVSWDRFTSFALEILPWSWEKTHVGQLHRVVVEHNCYLLKIPSLIFSNTKQELCIIVKCSWHVCWLMSFSAFCYQSAGNSSFNALWCVILSWWCNM